MLLLTLDSNREKKKEHPLRQFYTMEICGVAKAVILLLIPEKLTLVSCIIFSLH